MSTKKEDLVILVNLEDCVTSIKQKRPKIGVHGGSPCSDDFIYASNQNCVRLSQDELRVLLRDFIQSEIS